MYLDHLARGLIIGRIQVSAKRGVVWDRVSAFDIKEDVITYARKIIFLVVLSVCMYVFPSVRPILKN